jgi:outer membrane receptor protein involved in Fe transport
MRLTAGARYSYTEKSITGFDSNLNPSGVVAVVEPYQGKDSLDRGDWKVGTEYDLTKVSMIYANVATGFAPGGFSASPAVLGQTAAAPSCLRT